MFRVCWGRFIRNARNTSWQWSFNNAVELNPNDINAPAKRGEIFLKLGKFQEAAQDLRRAIELDPAKKNAADPFLHQLGAVKDMMSTVDQTVQMQQNLMSNVFLGSLRM